MTKEIFNIYSLFNNNKKLGVVQQEKRQQTYDNLFVKKKIQMAIKSKESKD